MMSCRLMLIETVVSAAPVNTALTEPENHPPAATSRLALKLISRILISPLRPNLAMALVASSPRPKACSAPSQSFFFAPSTTFSAAVTAAFNGIRAVFVTSNDFPVILKVCFASSRVPSVGALRPRQVVFSDSHAASGATMTAST